MMATDAGSASSRRLAWLLVGSFALTIASFVAASAVSEYRARGIEEAAESITGNALPTVDCLSRARTELREISLLLERLSDEHGGPKSAAEDMSRLARTRDVLATERNRCLALPNYPGEEEIEDRASARAREMDASIDEVLRRYEAGNRQAAAQELHAKTQTAIDRLDAELVEEIDLNASQSTALGARIAELRASSRRTGAVLNALSAVLAAIAAFVMLRILRRFARLMETRVSDLEHFAGRVAHDIRSPLASVGLALDLTKRDPELGLKKGVLDRATTTLQRVGQLVDGLLLFARAGKAPEEGTMASVGEILAGVVDDMRPFAEKNGITLELEPVVAGITARCSPGVFVSLISNLVGNAIKFMGTSDVRRVTVRARDIGRSVLVEVSDTGPGVPASEKDRIFDPYVRAAEATIPGIGLGLATVRRLADAHGGAVGVRANVDRGSVFWFELPKARTPSRRAVGRDWAPVG